MVDKASFEVVFVDMAYIVVAFAFAPWHVVDVVVLVVLEQVVH